LTSALQTGAWLSTNEAPMSPISPWAAVLHTAFGTQDQRVSDLSALSSILADQKDKEKYVTKEITREFHRYLRALDANDDENTNFYGNRVHFYLHSFGLSPDQRADIMTYLHGIQDNNMLIHRIPWEVFGNPRNTPEGYR